MCSVNLCPFALHDIAQLRTVGKLFLGLSIPFSIQFSLFYPIYSLYSLYCLLSLFRLGPSLVSGGVAGLAGLEGLSRAACSSCSISWCTFGPNGGSFHILAPCLCSGRRMSFAGLPSRNVLDWIF